MDIEKFTEEVNDAMRRLSDYAHDVSVEIVPDGDECNYDEPGWHTAEIHLKTSDDSEWTIPIKVSRDNRRHEQEAVIHTYEDSFLNLDYEGLYAYLWIEAVERLAKINRERGCLNDSSAR